ncbi:K(+)/H(+) antiporter NhaP2 [wastewater metagenome]|uniref:K(+)/H(+) antiporter NhaP2 n=2 Tax=unclassified sequences TaxID=12908 RepID=A0A5B8RDE0_9ZZZZ|nr:MULTISPECIES: sodium:proton antiporter [Arhodomonas]MCS4503191.1 cation:proton antiporter [Arhodomonas aquaeolei]QEA04727.1 K(+)/H(+) antiporter NhaP2 [uncultured organism]
MPESHLTDVLVVIAVLGVGAQWLAWRLQWPAIVVLCIFGVVAGPVTGWLVPSRDLGELVHPVIRLCVAVILFEGGLSLRWHEFREARSGVRRLLFPALPLNWLLGSLAAHYIGGLPWPVALVFGAIIVVTGPTVIMPLLRHAALRRRPASYLKWEGIINDPLGAMLAVLVFQFFVTVQAPSATLEIVWRLIGGALVGAGGGYLAARGMVALFLRGQVAEFLKPPVLLVSVLVVYAGANAVQAEAGLLAATVMGMVLGNSGLADIQEVRRFKEYLAVLLVSTVFILLSADVDTAMLAMIDGRAVALLLAVVFVVRPVAIWLATQGTPMTRGERALVAWIAPRGIVAAAVAGVFAPEMAAAGYPEARALTPLVFLLVLVTVVLHGFSIRTVALRLGLASRDRHGLMIVGASPWSVALAIRLRELGVYVIICDQSWHRLRAVRLASIPYFYGEVLSETAEQSLDLADIGYLVAATDNDAYNALVCSRYTRDLGREHVFQLPTDAEDHPRQIQRPLTGRPLYGREARYEVLQQRYYQGWRLQRTRITRNYRAGEYFAGLGDDTMPMIAVRADGGLRLREAGRALAPERGDVVLAFMSPRAQQARRPARGRHTEDEAMTRRNQAPAGSLPRDAGTDGDEG